MKTPTHSLKLTVLLVICGIVMACSQGPTPIAQATDTEAAPAKIAAGPSGPLGGHDIIIKNVDGRNVFFNQAYETVFVPRGNNYIRLAEGVNHFGNIGQYHSLFNVGHFDQAAIEGDFKLMRDLGYNTVRVFINTETPDGITHPKYGLSAEYLANLIKFLELAEAYDLYVIITHDWLPYTEPYTSILTADDPRFGGFNRIFLTPQGIEVSKRFWADLIIGLRETTATRRILAYEIQNEFFYDTTQPPFSLPPIDPVTGPLLITTANGTTYNLSNPAQVQLMMDESMIYFLNSVTRAIKDVDATALVTNGFFVPFDYETRRFETYPAIAFSELDFVDLHIYPHEFWDTPDEYATDFGINLDTAKPVLIGEFGAFRGEFGRIPPVNEYVNNREAAGELTEWQVASCKFGADGWLTWTWDTNEQVQLYSALGDASQVDMGIDPSSAGPSVTIVEPGDPPPAPPEPRLVDPENGIVGYIAYGLSPVGRPDPCEKSGVIVTSPVPDPVLKIVGKEEVVFDWTKDRCEEWHIPDLAARAFKDGTGQVQLITSASTNYRLVGPDLNHLTPDCKPIMTSNYNADPSMFNDAEWIAAPYMSDDGRTVYALVHNEYEGNTHVDLYPERCPSRDYLSCWYNTITLARSDNGGASYHDALPYPLHLAASLPSEYVPDAGPYGLRTPSNIILGNDGYYYTFLNAIHIKDNTESQWTCLMRTRSLADPASWRFWNGTAFEGQFADPYRDPILNPDDHTCEAIAPDDIGAMNESITYNMYLGRYVLLGLMGDWLDGRQVWGVYYAFSEDLIHWTHRKLLVELPLPSTVEDGLTDLSYAYPTLIAPDSTSRNFETTYDTAYLYLTRHNFGHGSPDRDLIRYSVTFFPSQAEADAAGP